MEIVDYAVTPALKLGTDVIWVSSQWYIVSGLLTARL